jgi:DNA-binding transcriptional MerR regulator
MITDKTVSDKTHTISELAKEFGVTTRTMRFYEEKGLLSPRREGQKRLYSAADRVRIKLILRGKRIGMSLDECVEVIDMYDPEHNNSDQLHSLIDKVKFRSGLLEQQKKDIDEMLAGLKEVRNSCETALKSTQDKNPTQRKRA